MTDGQRLKSLLDRHKKSVAQLADALGIKRTMGYNYTNSDRHSPLQYRKLVEALPKLGIDPTELRGAPTAIMDPTELRKLLDGVPHSALPSVRRMLEITDPSTKIGLLALIDDRIDRIK